MTFQNCEPVVLPECVLDELMVGELLPEPSDTHNYEISVAIARAATAVIRAHGLMEVADTFVTIGNPGAWPKCCNVVGVGVIEFLTERDGTCLTLNSPVFELLVSTCKPAYDAHTDMVPTGGPIDGCEPDSLSGHALAFHRVLAAINRDLGANICCFLPDIGCCDTWVIESVTVDNSESCSEMRFRIIAG